MGPQGWGWGYWNKKKFLKNVETVMEFCIYNKNLWRKINTFLNFEF